MLHGACISVKLCVKLIDTIDYCRCSCRFGICMSLTRYSMRQNWFQRYASCNIMSLSCKFVFNVRIRWLMLLQIIFKDGFPSHPKGANHFKWDAVWMLYKKIIISISVIGILGEFFFFFFLFMCCLEHQNSKIFHNSQGSINIFRSKSWYELNGIRVDPDLSLVKTQ